MRREQCPLWAKSDSTHRSKNRRDLHDLFDHIGSPQQRFGNRESERLRPMMRSNLVVAVTYCESSVLQKRQRCAGVNVNSRAKNLGSSDWNSSSALAYAAHAGVLGRFGSPVLANCVQ